MGSVPGLDCQLLYGTGTGFCSDHAEFLDEEGTGSVGLEIEPKLNWSDYVDALSDDVSETHFRLSKQAYEQHPQDGGFGHVSERITQATLSRIEDIRDKDFAGAEEVEYTQEEIDSIF